MVDSHTHLSSCAPADGELVAAAAAAGVDRIVTVGTDHASRRAALEAAEAFDGVWAAIGHHPNEHGFDDTVLADVAELARHPRCVAVGETGLDLFRDTNPPLADQERAFHAQIELARELGKPLVIHSRAADDATIAALRDRAGGVAVVLHCFSMPGRLDECLDQGWTISFAGNVTYPRNADLAEAAARVPEGRLLVETDAPYLTPQPVRKHRNQPAFVTHTAAFVAERRGQRPEELEAEVAATAAALFGWS